MLDCPALFTLISQLCPSADYPDSCARNIARVTWDATQPRSIELRSTFIAAAQNLGSATAALAKLEQYRCTISPLLGELPLELSDHMTIHRNHLREIQDHCRVVMTNTVAQSMLNAAMQEGGAA